MHKNLNLAWFNPSKVALKEESRITAMERSILIQKISKISSQLRGRSAVIKLPTAIMENCELLDNFADNVAALSSCGLKIFIIHDYTNCLFLADPQYGLIQENKIHQINDEKSYEIIETALCGRINRYVVTLLGQRGLTAIGISGKDGNLITAKKTKKPLTINETSIPNFYVSEPLIISPEILFTLEEANIIAVISPVALNEQKKTCILEIDSTAANVASSIAADHLFLLGDLKNGKNFITIQDEEELEEIKDDNLLHASINKSLIQAAYYNLINRTGYVHFVNCKMKDSIIDIFFS